MELDMDRIVELLEKWDTPAYVEQSGGGTATIYAGHTYMNSDGDEVYPVLAGPGWFSGPNWSMGRGDSEDFSVGFHEHELYAEQLGEKNNYAGFESEEGVAAAIAECLVRWEKIRDAWEATTTFCDVCATCGIAKKKVRKLMLIDLETNQVLDTTQKCIEHMKGTLTNSTGTSFFNQDL